MIDSDKFWNIIDNADSFSIRVNTDKPEFGWAKQVNLAFALELYIKAIMEFEKQRIERGHNLKKLFKQLSSKTQSLIYENWRTLSGKNIPDTEQVKEWFTDNLFACCNVFEKFRYVHEWSGCSVSLEASWDSNQWSQLSIFSREREFGKLQVYSGFLKEFENAIKKHIKDNIIPKLPRPTYDMSMSIITTATITRADGSTKNESNNIVTSMNIPNVNNGDIVKNSKGKK